MRDERSRKSGQMDGCELEIESEREGTSNRAEVVRLNCVKIAPQPRPRHQLALWFWQQSASEND